MQKKRDEHKIAFHFEASPYYKKFNNHVKFFLPAIEWENEKANTVIHPKQIQTDPPSRKLGKDTRSNAGLTLCSTSTTCSHHLRLLPLNPSSNPPTNRGQNSSTHTHYTHTNTHTDSQNTRIKGERDRVTKRYFSETTSLCFSIEPLSRLVFVQISSG